MANTRVELVDEDAADLQFPKDSTLANDLEYEERSTEICYICGMWLREPYISCVDCKGILICANCFANGGERSPHANHHPYSVVRNEFQLIGGWTAKEELTLLESMIECGAGNWEAVARKLGTHSAKDCKNHYFNFYVENTELQLQEAEVFPRCLKVESGPQSALAFYKCDEKSPQFEPPDESMSPQVVSLEQPKTKMNPFLKQQQQQMQRVDPSRPFFECRATQFISGYNAARGEFTVEFDDNAESLLSELDDEILDSDDPDSDLMSEMAVSAIKAYNERLRERTKRKQVIRQHGLLLLQKTLGWLQRFDNTIGRETAEKLSGLMRVTTGTKFDYFMESLHATGELRTKIMHLKELRSKGITNYRAWKMFCRLSDIRTQSRKDWPTIDFSAALAGGANAAPCPVQAAAPRKQPQPLDIMALPGYEKLTPSERNLCSILRLAPLSFLDFRDILVTESRRHPGSSLKLAQARTLIKIDVNKTRKLYDFLLSEGYFTQGS